MKSDKIQRELAVNSKSNVIIRAGAGAGKTSIILEFYLKQLLIAKRPEEILNITFTNQAVAEIRERVFSLFDQVKSNATPKSDFEKKLFDLAAAVLKKDKQSKWGLENNPNILEISTIDSLFSSIAKRYLANKPLGVAISNVTDTPQVLYQAAANELLSSYVLDDHKGQSVKALLTYCKNDFEKASTYLVNLLECRDQWIDIISLGADRDNVKRILEQNLKRAIGVLAAPSLEALGKYKDQIEPLASYAASNLGFNGFKGIPTSLKNYRDIESIKFLTKILLKKEKKVAFRATGNKSVGFPAATDFKDKGDKELAKSMKEQFKELLTAISEDEQLDNGFALLKEINGLTYNLEEWALLQHLLVISPYLLAHLRLVFIEQRQCDFQEVALSALEAMGTEEEPGEALLYLDRKYNKLIGDEFQDTDYTQYKFYKLLTGNWSTSNGKQYFLVGDPMQSIYGFRGSNVGFFTKILEEGLNDDVLEVFTFGNNYRSTPEVVDANNIVFDNSFPRTSNESLGAVNFQPLVAQREHGLKQLEMKAFVGPSDVSKVMEADYIVSKIKEIQASEPTATIGVIARAKSHLSEVEKALEAQESSFLSINVNDISRNRSFINTLSLAKVLSEPVESVPMVSLLRSPMIGLTLKEIGALKPLKNSTYLESLRDDKKLAALPQGTKDKLVRLRKILDAAISQFMRKPFAEIVKGAFIELHGYSMLRDKNDLEAVEQLFDKLSGFALSKPSNLSIDNQLSSLKCEVSKGDDVRKVKLMTVHAAKGLEFDYVFTPGALARTKASERRILAFDVIFDDAKAFPVVTSKVDGSGTSYELINRLNRIKESYETERLRYVAQTRAKVQNIVTGTCKQESLMLSTDSMMSSLTKVFQDQLEVVLCDSEVVIGEIKATSAPGLSEILVPERAFLPENSILAQYRGSDACHFSSLNMKPIEHIKRVSSDVFKKQLKQALRMGVDEYKAIPEQLLEREVKRAAAEAGVGFNKINKVHANVAELMARTMSDDDFQSILNSEGVSTDLRVGSLNRNEIKEVIVDIAKESEWKVELFDIKVNEKRDSETNEEYIERVHHDYQFNKMKVENAFSSAFSKETSYKLYLADINLVLDSGTITRLKQVA